jgi:hypothetical protein
MASLALRSGREQTSPPVGAGVRLAAGGFLLCFALALAVGSLSRGALPWIPLVLGIGAVALLLGRFGRTLHYLLPTLLGFASYLAARHYVTGFKLPVHYLLQLRVDEHLTGGTVPTAWLQEHLYHGRTGPLEIAAMLVYVSHFVVPLVFGAALIFTDRSRDFVLLMFGILVTLLAGELVFVLFPTAPPWMAARDGYLPGVHHVLKQTFLDVHLSQLASVTGDPSKYDTTAAVPSLHVAFPVVCLLVAVRARLPRPVVAAFALNVLAVAFAIVFLGEHYVFDALTGGLCGAGAWYLVHALQRRGRARDAEASIGLALPEPGSRT